MKKQCINDVAISISIGVMYEYQPAMINVYEISYRNNENKNNINNQ